MKHATDRRTPQELDAENRAILRENGRAERYTRLLTNMRNEAEAWPDASRDFFLDVLDDLHHNGDGGIIWPEGMATFERRLMQDKFDKLTSLRPQMAGV